MNWLFLFLPVTLALEHAGAAAPWVFFSAALAIVPIASLIVRATEQIAARTGDAVGGLLNATFGNAPELYADEADDRCLRDRFATGNQVVTVAGRRDGQLGKLCAFGAVRIATYPRRLSSGQPRPMTFCRKSFAPIAA